MVQKTATAALIARAREAYAMGDYGASLALTEEVCSSNPGFADIHNLRGLCYAVLGRTEEALAAFEEAIELNRDYSEAHINRALTLNELGRFDDAIAAFQYGADAAEMKVDKRYPPPLAARLANQHAELGDLYQASGFLPEAAEQYRRACGICPGYADVRNKLGRTLLDFGLSDAALRELRAALEVNPGYVAARANLGLALFRIGQYQQAELEWEQCLEAAPGDAQVTAYLNMLYREEAVHVEPQSDDVAAD